MRIPVLASLLGLSLFACAGNITGGGDDDVPENCGNGVVDEGEECDGSESCTATCTEDPTATPRLDASVDKPTTTSQLMKDVTVTATLTSAANFAGPVAIAATVVDDANTPLPLITVAGPTTVDLTAGQSAPATFTVTIPSNATGTAMTANLKLAITSSAGNHDLTTAIAIEPTLIIAYPAGSGANIGAHSVGAGLVPAMITIKRGTMVGYKNDDTVRHVTHGDNGLDHENDGDPTTGAPGATYLQPTIAIAPGGNTPAFGCHTHGSATYVNFTIE